MEFQTRNEDGEVRQFNTFMEAKEHANVDKTVWKISFTLKDTNERIRLIRDHTLFIYQNIDGSY